jgi:two-component system chemotaxis response regulator CheY
MRVLIVDDSRSVRNFIKAALKSVPETFIIDEVESGFEAFRFLARDSFDVLITDINMPDINGLELIRFVKKSARHASCGILVITTQTTERMREKSGGARRGRISFKAVRARGAEDRRHAVCEEHLS